MGNSAIHFTTVTSSHCFESMIQGMDAVLQNAARSVALKTLYSERVSVVREL
jgi:hypothetical protein